MPTWLTICVGLKRRPSRPGPDLRPERRRGLTFGPGWLGGAHADLGEVAVERGIDPADPLDQRRMGGEGPQEMADGVAEEQVARLLGLGGVDARPLGQGADLLEGAGDPVRIARELHGRRVGQELALAAHRGLDQVAEEDADIAQHVERQPDQRPGIRPAPVVVATVLEREALAVDRKMIQPVMLISRMP